MARAKKTEAAAKTTISPETPEEVPLSVGAAAGVLEPQAAAESKTRAAASVAAAARTDRRITRAS